MVWHFPCLRYIEQSCQGQVVGLSVSCVDRFFLHYSSDFLVARNIHFPLRVCSIFGTRLFSTISVFKFVFRVHVFVSAFTNNMKTNMPPLSFLLHFIPRRQPASLTLLQRHEILAPIYTSLASSLLVLNLGVRFWNSFAEESDKTLILLKA
jgi:hypothetical protein